MTENKELLIQKLEAVTDAWKRLYEEPVPKGTWSLRFAKTANINLQLKWGIKEGILFLDGIWIAPVQFIDLEKLDKIDEAVQPIGFDIPLTDGTLEIVIIEEQGGFEIHAIDRHIMR